MSGATPLMLPRPEATRDKATAYRTRPPDEASGESWGSGGLLGLDGGARLAGRDAGLVGLEQALHLVHELVDVLELAIHRREAHVGHLVEPLQMLHDQITQFEA